MEDSWRRKWKVVRKWNVIVWEGILFLFSVSWHHSTLLQAQWASVSLKSCPVWFVFVYVLTACVFITRDTVRHPRSFVFGKFVRKPNCSWSEVWLYIRFHLCTGRTLITEHFSPNMLGQTCEISSWNVPQMWKKNYAALLEIRTTLT